MIIQGKFVELSSDINDNVKMLKDFCKWELYTIKDLIIYAGIIIFLLIVTFWLIIKSLFMKYVVKKGRRKK
jgi:hypothetical protein